MPSQHLSPLTDPKRLAQLHGSGLLDPSFEQAFDRLTKLASKIIKAPVALLSLVDQDRQFFKSFVGLAEPWATQRETPLSHSFCQHVVTSGTPLIVEDAREHPLVQDNLAIPDLGVISYAGMPVTTSDDAVLGSFCVIDTQPRQWTEDEIEIMRELTTLVMTEIELRQELRVRQEETARREALQAELIRMQAETVAALTTPIIPISDEVIVLPLIGNLDEGRARKVVETLLTGVTERRARHALIDITGVPVVDTQVAGTLIRAAQAVRLVGAQVSLTGISPAIAQTLVSLGVDLHGITTHGTLQQGIAGTLTLSGRR